MSGKLLLVAASGLAREAAESARRAGWEVLGCLDDNTAIHGTEVMPGLPVLGGLDAVDGYPDAQLLLCAGKGATRQSLAERLAGLGVGEDRYAVLLDPSVVVPPSCSVGAGSIVLAGTVLTASVSVGQHVVCMPHVVLTHDDVIGGYVTLCAGAVLGGAVTVGEGAYIGMSSTVRESIFVGSGSLVGMGAVVTRDVAPAVTVAGVPAHALEGALP